MSAPTIERRKMTQPVAVPRARTPLWQAVAWVLVIIGIYDGGVLTFGPARYFSSPGYSAVRSVGLKPVGMILLVITCSLIYCLGAPTRTRLAVVLAAGFAYNVFWLAALLYSWFSVGIAGLTGPSKAFGLAAFYLLLATRIDDRRGS